LPRAREEALQCLPEVYESTVIVVEEEIETAPKKTSEIIPMTDLRGSRGERKIKKIIYHRLTYHHQPLNTLSFWLTTQYTQYRCHLHYQVRNFG
jgi:hypothetical protein